MTGLTATAWMVAGGGKRRDSSVSFMSSGSICEKYKTLIQYNYIHKVCVLGGGGVRLASGGKIQPF